MGRDILTELDDLGWQVHVSPRVRAEVELEDVHRELWPHLVAVCDAAKEGLGPAAGLLAAMCEDRGARAFGLLSLLGQRATYVVRPDDL